MLIDSHAHLVSLEEDLGDVLARAKENGVEKIVSISSDIPSTEATIALSEAHNYIFATTGVHPHNADKMCAEVLSGMDNYATHEKVVAIGETGLDYFYMNSEREEQIYSRWAKPGIGQSLVVGINDQRVFLLEISIRQE